MAFDNAGLLFQIKADPSDAMRAFGQVDRQINQLSGSATGLTSSFASMINPAALAAAGVTALAAAAVAAASALFDLTKETGKYGDAIFDVAQKTGVSTDALQALKFAADQSGSSFEAVEKSLTRFSVTLGKSAVEGSEADKMLEKYGITARDIDGALEQAIKAISNLSTVEQQNAAAAELFTDKSGNLVNIIREMDGDLPGTIKNLKDLGVVMGKDDVKAAAEFTDQLATLNTQLDGVYRTIGTDVLPIFLEFAQAVSTWLKENRSEVKFWSEGFKVSILAVVNSIRLAYNWWAGLGDMIYSTGQALYYFATRDFAKVRAVYDEWARNQTARNKIIGSILRGETVLSGLTPTGELGGSTGGLSDDTGLAAAEAEKRRKERDAEAKREQASQARYFDLQIKGIRDHYQEVQEAAEKAFIDRVDTEKQFTEKSNKILAKYRTDTEAYLSAAFEIDSAGKNADEIFNLRLEKTQAIATIGREVNRQLADNVKLVADVNKKEDDAHKQRVKNWNERRKEQKEFHDDENKFIDEEIKKEQELHDQRKKNWNEMRKMQQQRSDDEEADRQKADRATIDSSGQTNLGRGLTGLGRGLGAGGVDIFDAFGNIKTAAEMTKEVYRDMAEVAGEAIGSMVNGLAQLAANWLITGEFSAKAALSMMASIALQLATSAGMEALMQVAKGIAETAAAAASAAVGDLRGAALHTAAAAAHYAAASAFGVVAAVAGGAGVGLALGARAASGGGSASSPSDLSRQQAQEDRTAISRYSATAGTSGRQTWEAAIVTQYAGLSKAVDGLNNKIGSMQPHEVMTRAENQRPGITASHAVNGIASNGGLGTRLQRVTGARR